MDAETIRGFQQVISKVHWLLTFDEFCERTGWMSDYAAKKWHDWQELQSALSKFDPETLAKITGG